ncbi:hypothetical protein, partial [Clostridium autoethanogenum]
MPNNLIFNGTASDLKTQMYAYNDTTKQAEALTISGGNLAVAGTVTVGNTVAVTVGTVTVAGTV